MAFQPLSLLLLPLLTLVAPAQTVIQAEDLFSQPGHWYRSWQNDQPVPSGTLIGEPGGLQVWDFSTGPQDQELLTTVVGPEDSGHAAGFPGALFAERQQNQVSGDTSWLMLELDTTLGRRVHGFVDESFSPQDPVVEFGQPLLDFPLPMQFQDSWTASTWFLTSISGLSARIDYTADFVADAWGTLILPQLGPAPCLRVMELTEFAISVDFGGNGTYTPYTTQYIRSYHFLSTGRGIAASIVSGQSTAIPPVQFGSAAVFLRLFATNHPGAEPVPNPVDDLAISVIPTGALLTWSPVPGASAYRVESSEAGQAGPWQTLATVPMSSYLDAGARPLPRRSYRVIASSQ
jgi:hypothetical protein